MSTVLGSSWVFDSGLVGANGANGSLTAGVAQSAWGVWPITLTGTYSIDPDFWLTNTRAALSFQLAGGSGPGWLFFEITPGTTSGTFSIVRLFGTGGGLTQIGLWGDSQWSAFGPGNPNAVIANPEPASLILFGTGLAVATMALRRRFPRKELRRQR